MDKLRELVNKHSSGPISGPEITALQNVVAESWDELLGHEAGGMAGYKLIGRMESVAWDGLQLTFDIERHGTRALGSVYAEVQLWRINVETGGALLTGSTPRLVGADARGA